MFSVHIILFLETFKIYFTNVKGLSSSADKIYAEHNQVSTSHARVTLETFRYNKYTDFVKCFYWWACLFRMKTPPIQYDQNPSNSCASIHHWPNMIPDLNLACLHAVACIRSGSGVSVQRDCFNSCLLFLFKLSAICFGRTTIFRRKHVADNLNKK
jgi:hypothetical protein